MKNKIIMIIIMSALVALTIIPITTSAEVVPNGECFAEYVTEQNSGIVLKAKNEDSKHAIASMVKIMTATLVLEAVDRGEISLDQKITISPEASSMGGSQMFLDIGEQYTVSDLLKGVIVVSANDASVALAELIAGSHSQFVHMMNERAKQLKMENTLYSNATGLPSEAQQYSTARDVNIITRQLMSHPKYFDYSTIWLEDYKHPSGRITQFANTNKLVKFYKGCKGGKTGFTSEAGFGLSACAERNGLTVVATVIGAKDSKTRFNCVKTMFDNAFDNYKNQIVYTANKPLEQSVAVKGGRQNSLKICPVADVSVLSDKQGQLSKIMVNMPAQINAPVKVGDVVGNIEIITNESSYKVDLVAMNDIQKATIWDKIKNIFDKF